MVDWALKTSIMNNKVFFLYCITGPYIIIMADWALKTRFMNNNKNCIVLLALI